MEIKNILRNLVDYSDTKLQKVEVNGKIYRIVTLSTGAIATSDGHSLYELGTSWTEIDEIDREYPGKFLDSLRKSVQNTKETKREKTSSRIGAFIMQ